MLTLTFKMFTKSRSPEYPEDAQPLQRSNSRLSSNGYQNTANLGRQGVGEKTRVNISNTY